MSARVGRSGSEGKPAVETKPQEAVLSLSLPTWAKAKANPVPQFCMQPRNVSLVGAPHGIPITSTWDSAYFHTYSCLEEQQGGLPRKVQFRPWNRACHYESYDPIICGSCQ